MSTINEPDQSMCSIALGRSGQDGSRMRMNVVAHQEKEKNKKTARGRQEKRKDRPILKRLRAILLRSFRGLHGEKMICVRGVPEVTGILWKANSHSNLISFLLYLASVPLLLYWTILLTKYIPSGL